MKYKTKVVEIVVLYHKNLLLSNLYFSNNCNSYSVGQKAMKATHSDSIHGKQIFPSCGREGIRDFLHRENRSSEKGTRAPILRSRGNAGCSVDVTSRYDTRWTSAILRRSGIRKLIGQTPAKPAGFGIEFFTDNLFD